MPFSPRSKSALLWGGSFASLSLLTLLLLPTPAPKPPPAAKPAPVPLAKAPSPLPETSPAPAAAAPAPLQRTERDPVSFQPNNFVESITDGDTVLLRDGDYIRYIGIDTPEKDQPFYQEAKELNARLVKGKAIRIEEDVASHDHYRRRLGYLYVLDDTGHEVFVNAEILRAGLASLYTISPNVKHVEALLQCQREAREHRRGIWAEPVAPEEYYIGSKNSFVFHRPSCDGAQKIREDNLTRFETRDSALDGGRSPCRSCKP